MCTSLYVHMRDVETKQLIHEVDLSGRGRSLWGDPLVRRAKRSVEASVVLVHIHVRVHAHVHIWS